MRRKGLTVVPKLQIPNQLASENSNKHISPLATPDNAVETFIAQEKFGTFALDLFDIESSHPRPLQLVAESVMARYEVCLTFNIPRDVMTHFLSMLDAGYHKTNQYHNAT